MGRKLEANNVYYFSTKFPSFVSKSILIILTFLFEKGFLRKERKEHSIVYISSLMIIDKIVLVVY